MKATINSYWRLARFDKPVGIWLLMLPCWLGLALAGSIDPYLYFLFAIGSAAMRAAGCVINDIVDRKFDAMVERTKTRPIASGEVSVRNAAIFLALLLLIGLAVAVQLPKISIQIAFGILPIVVIYPFMKRITNWPQLFLGICFNIGVLVAYATVTGTIGWQALLVYVGAIFWTLGYDTIYAQQDKEDDLKVGVKSTAIALGAKSRKWISIFYKLFILCFTAAAYHTIHFEALNVILIVAAYVVLMWQVVTMNEKDSENCLTRFKANTYVGLLLTLALLVTP